MVAPTLLTPSVSFAAKSDYYVSSRVLGNQAWVPHPHGLTEIPMSVQEALVSASIFPSLP